MTSALRKPTPIDAIEARLLELGAEMRPFGQDGTVAPVQHIFTPGLYARQIFMPAGSLITSARHMTEHPFVVSQGRCIVYIEDGGAEIIQAPHTGVTKPGTRRFLIVVEDTIWTTFHVTEKTTVAEVEAEILAPHDNPYLPDGFREQLEAST